MHVANLPTFAMPSYSLLPEAAPGVCSLPSIQYPEAKLKLLYQQETQEAGTSCC